MKKLLVFIFVPMFSLGQTHFINNYDLYMNGNTNSPDISVNTYFNTLDTCNISWSIINDSLPSQWDFSICFPTCYPIGVVSNQNTFLPNEQLYLNCHMYPNGQSGYGFIQMEIITNNTYKDTITWTGSIINLTSFEENNLEKEIVKITDMLGRETKNKNQPLIYFYDDWSIERKMVIY